MTENKPVKIYREIEGIVAKSAQNKTAVVVVDRRVRHKKYKKQYTISTRYKVHDELNACQEGDKVLFRECRPLSKCKCWRLIKKID